MKTWSVFELCSWNFNSPDVAIWTRFHAPQQSSPPPTSAITHHWIQQHHQMHFSAVVLILVPEILFNFGIDVQSAEKAICEIIFNIWWNHEQI